MAERSALASASAGATTMPSQRQQCRELMHHRAMHQVNECLAVCLHSPRSEDKWTVVKREKNLELYAKRSNTTKSVFFLGMNELHCGFDEVYELLNYQSTTQFRLVMKLLYGINFRDGALMATHAPRQYDDDYDVADVQHAALWFTLQARRESILGKDNMLAFFQALMVLHPDRSFTTAGSSTLGMSATAAAQDAATFARPSENIQKRTLALAWLPFLENEGKTMMQTSMRLHYTLIVEEVARHKLRVSCVTKSFRDGDDIHQSRSSSAARTIAKRLVNRSISRLEAAVVAARISTQTLRLPHQWVANKDRVKCVVCWKPFNAIIRRRHHCRLCGEVVCGSCSAVRNKTAAESHQTQDLEKVRVCHMCSNRRGSNVGLGRGDAFNVTRGAAHDAFISPAVLGNSTAGSFVGVSHVPILEGEDSDHDAFARRGSNDTVGSGYLGFYGTGGSTGMPSTSTQKLISLRSMTKADLLARSNSTQSSRKPNGSSQAPSSPYQQRGWSPRVQGPALPPAFVGRNTTPKRAPPPPPPTQIAYHGARPMLLPPPLEFAARRGEELDMSFLDPSIRSPELALEDFGPKSIVAAVGSHDRLSSLDPIDSMGHIMWSNDPFAGETLFESKMESEQSQVSDYSRRTSAMTLGTMSEGNTPWANDTKAPKVDHIRENKRLKLMSQICSPACTLVDRQLMRECCNLAADAFGVHGAFIARLDEHYVQIEHIVGTTKLSAMDHFLRRDTPCEFVLETSPAESPFYVEDSSTDKRTSGMIMVRDLGMRLFTGINIYVRGLPIACLCVFSEHDDHEYEGKADNSGGAATCRLSVMSALSTSQYEFQALEKAALQISRELENLVVGMALD